jgi:hypothetical protein
VTKSKHDAQLQVRQIIIPTNINPRPERFEIEAASIVAEYLRADAVFIARDSSKTPDVQIDGLEWGIKSPRGTSKHTIETQLKRASRQAAYVVIDARRCKIHIAKIRAQLRHHGAIKKHIKRILLITKAETVEEIK